MYQVSQIAQATPENCGRWKFLNASFWCSLHWRKRRGLEYLSFIVMRLLSLFSLQHIQLGLDMPGHTDQSTCPEANFLDLIVTDADQTDFNKTLSLI